MARARILDISFSPLARDARVLRQLSVVATHGEVTTVGYGPTTPWSTRHVEVPASASSLPRTLSGVTNLALHRHSACDLAAPAARHALDQVAPGSHDLVIANDARALPVALELAGRAPVWVDLHEWAPEERTHVTSWRLLIAPWIDHVCRTHLPRAAAATTVGARIADLYESRYGVRPDLMRNAAPFADLSPTPIPEDGPLRLVHSGAAVPGRALETTIDAVIAAGDGFTLDLYLVPGGDGGRYFDALRERASTCPRIRFRQPVPPGDLPATLNAYDVGVFWIPPVTTNARLTLPNKFFDFVQARLALAVGPSVEMADLVGEHHLGVVSAGFDVDDIVSSLHELTRERVRTFKDASHAAAGTLSFEAEADVAHRIVARLLDR